MTTHQPHPLPGDATHAAAARRLLDETNRRVADPHAVAAAHVYATLAVAEAVCDATGVLTDIADRLQRLAGRTGAP